MSNSLHKEKIEKKLISMKMRLGHCEFEFKLKLKNKNGNQNE